MYIMPSEMNVTGWSGLLVWANTVTNNWFGNLILLTIWLIIMITLMFRDEPDKAFVTASFLTTLIALLFRGLGIIGELPLIIGIVMTAIGFILIGKK